MGLEAALALTLPEAEAWLTAGQDVEKEWGITCPLLQGTGGE